MPASRRHHPACHAGLDPASRPQLDPAPPGLRVQPAMTSSTTTTMSLIVFSHANSFPAGTYTQLFRQLRSRGFLVKAVDKFGHDSAYPVSNNWPGLVQQLHDF